MRHLANSWRALCPTAVAALMAVSSAAGDSDGESGRRSKVPLGVSSGGWGWYGAPYFVTVGPDGPVAIPAPWARPIPVVVIDRGPVAPAPGPVPVPAVNPELPPASESRARAKKSELSKAAQLVTIGDRLFRAGNLKRAAERYEQAARADPESAAPRVRLSQVALVRGHFAESARQIREAVAAEPDWLSRAGNIEAIYGEPSDFRRQISKLESRVHAEPTDRDAWLVLGAELYLSGQTRRAGDVFVRLSDRRPDPALAAFLDVTALPSAVK